ncbi:hypothetical protein [Halomonas sp. S2151]|uniref:hypothetical protein n=1 Tax=Halomonas sp. S2151 TaxID=579478 RepID=UPI000AF31B1E|nr:hypothetical protein [Halomonas sp. S2151]
MKRIDKKKKDIRSRVARKRFEEEHSRKNLKGPIKSKIAKGGYFGAKINAPEKLSIYAPGTGAFEDTVNFIEEIRNEFGPKKKVVDFSLTETMTAAAMAIVYCELELARGSERFKGKIVWSKSSRVNKMIKKTGISKLIFGSSLNFDIETIEDLPIISSQDTDLLEEVCDHMLKEYDGEGLDEKEYAVREARLSSAVFETVDNVCFHAYPRDSDEPKRWWLCCDVFGDTLYLAIYDNGVGIPSTVQSHKWFLDILERERPEVFEEAERNIAVSSNSVSKIVFNKVNDADLIYISMLDDFTETKEKKHGQGSKSIKALVNESEGGKLWVFSGRGMYKFERDEEHPELKRLSHKIPGTLVQWNINLS